MCHLYAHGGVVSCSLLIAVFGLFLQIAAIKVVVAGMACKVIDSSGKSCTLQIMHTLIMCLITMETDKEYPLNLKVLF